MTAGRVLAATLGLIALGTALLALPAATEPTARKDLAVYWARHAWQCAFDATSAVCGVGLLQYDYADDYTALGRSVLHALGVCAALLLVSGVAAGLRRVHPAAAPARLSLIAPLVLGAVGLVVWLGRGGGAAFGVDFAPPDPAGLRFAAIAPIAASGLFWLALLWPRIAAAQVERQAIVVFVAGGLWLACAGSVLHLLEAPRGAAAARGTADGGAARPGPRGLAQAALRTAEAAGSAPSRDARPTAAPDGARAVLAVAALAGGLLPGPAGGLGLVCILIALGVVRIGPADVRVALARVCGRAVLVWGGLALAVALGLLILEQVSAGRFQERPTFADALLDAAAALGGTRLTSGLTETVTGENLISGMSQTGGPDQVNMYQFGMVWLMLAMVVGRVYPLFVLRALSRAAATGSTPPLAGAASAP